MCGCFGQSTPSKKAAQPNDNNNSLTQRNPPVVPDMYELGRRVGLSEEDRTRLAKIEDKVDDIKGTISWMRGAWWILGAIILVIAGVIKFFGSSLFVAIEHRMERARLGAATKKT